MNGNTNTDNAQSGAASATSQADAQIKQALEIVHNPRSTSDHRREASDFLESLKQYDEAPYHGFNLASAATNPPIVRHFGLSLLETAIKYRWPQYSPEQSAAVRGWVLQLTQGISASDPSFIRNKIAQLWVEVAKRSWMLDWMDMDELLVKIWQGGPIEKFFVMEVLENLAENSFGKEDAIGAIRGDDLSNYCLDIFTPLAVFKEHFPNRDDLQCRHGEEGWLLRVVDFMSWCLGQDPKDETVAACAVKAAIMLKSCLEWSLMKAVMVTQTPDRLCQALMSSNRALLLEALQCLFLLFLRRNKFQPEDVTDLVLPMLSAENLDIFRKVYQWSTVDSQDIDEERYLICKKLTPLIFQLGLFIEEYPELFFGQIKLDPLFDLLLETVQNQSLHVSIPILHLWAVFLAHNKTRQHGEILSRVKPLLQIATERLIRYEELPEGTELPALTFLEEDVETPPERHQFLGNYARFAKDIVDGIVQQQPADALEYILHETDSLFEQLNREPAFDPARCTRYMSQSALRLDAQAAVIEASVFGYAKWRSEQRAMNPNQELVAAQQAKIDNSLEQWVMNTFSRSFKDPAVQQRLVTIFISFAVGPLRKSPQIVTSTFQYIMKTKNEFYNERSPQVDPEMYDLQRDELQKFCSHQLQRLAIKSHDFLAAQYDTIEQEAEKLTQLMGNGDTDRERVLSLPFIILQRATSLPEEQRSAKLTSYVESSLRGWSDPKVVHGLESLEKFCKLIGVDGFQDEFLARSAPTTSDWSHLLLLDRGQMFKTGIDNRKRTIPLAITRTILGASVDRADRASLEVAKAMWAPYIQTVVPLVVKLVKLSIEFSAPTTWANASADVQGLVRRIMKDRFWQVGISSGTREEFYNRVTSTRNTVEGLASAIRGSVRDVRETSFKILALLTYLGNLLYELDGLSKALCEAMFSHPMALSTHQTVVLLETSRALIEQCPEDKQQEFLPIFVTTLFDYLDEKISREWNVIDAKKVAASEDDDLTEEMKEESILRNLTFTTVLFVTRLLDSEPAKRLHLKPEDGAAGPKRLDIFVLENPAIFKSIITFCTHALRMHDSRCCISIVKVLRKIIPIFALSDSQVQNGGPGIPQLSAQTFADIREFISDEVFKACITSIHDPYFVEIQPDLALLIASIVQSYARLTLTPRTIILSLPNMTEAEVDSSINKLLEPCKDKALESRRQKTTVLKLLASLRGISVAEQGKILQQQQRERKKQDTALNKYAQGSVATKQIKTEDEDEGLVGVADMFQQTGE